MQKICIPRLPAELKVRLLQDLIAGRKVRAIQRYRFHFGCRLVEARDAVQRLVDQIEPGPAQGRPDAGTEPSV
ncbi:MAG: hypothetical protein D6722_07460 [Bacteroidetes bacterium]|nr:MAG: hypothetical protein D6722_07460 [Bacteroidota bacterium]